LALTLFPTIPADLKALLHREYTVRQAATKRLGSHFGFTAVYLKYHALRTTDPELRDRYESMAEQLQRQWNVELEWLSIQWDNAKLNAELEQYGQKMIATISANLAKLSAEDLKLVEAQHACPIHRHDPLGWRRVPVKIILKGQPVLLCCKECIKKAKANPDQTLAIVKELKEKPAPFLRKDQFEKIKEMSKSSKNKSPRP
ncbi:MAG: hypothetical protein ACRELG_25820, partial [Gemmataceae bacterium]